MRPCRMLKKLSPVEAVRYEQDQLTGKKHKKTVLVVLSLALSIILFNSTVAVVKGFDMDKYIESFAVTDFVVTSSSIISQMSLETDTKAISQETAKALNNTPGLTDSGMVYMDESEQNLDSKALERTKAIFNERKDDFVTEDEKAWIKECIFKNNYINSHVYGISDFIYGYTEIAKGEFDADKFESGKYAVVSGYDDTGKYRYYDIGDTIKVDFADGTTKSYEVMAIGDITYALSVQHGHGMDISILLPEKEYLEHSVGEDNAMLAAFNVNDIEFDKAQEYVSAYCESSDAKLGCKSKKDYIDSFHSMELMYLIVGGALSFIIGLIGILNFINMTITSINTRRRELAVLQAVGMTDKQMRKMLVKEGVNKILLTFAFVITIGSVVSMAIVKLITMEMWMFTYHFTVWPVFVSMPVFLIIAVIVPELVHKRMKKSSLTARLADNV